MEELEGLGALEIKKKTFNNLIMLLILKVILESENVN